MVIRIVESRDRPSTPNGEAAFVDHESHVSTDAPTAPPESRRRSAIQMARRLGWGVADQGVANLSNFALELFVTRSFSASSFGAFTLAFFAYTVVIALADHHALPEVTK
jgi:hypothetical protein